VVLDHDRVAEQGTQHQLRHAGGYYQRMWDKDEEPVSWPGYEAA
jgi:ABC-type multidrug transport system fused ATPase/permease subunit